MARGRAYSSTAGIPTGTRPNPTRLRSCAASYPLPASFLTGTLRLERIGAQHHSGCALHYSPLRVSHAGRPLSRAG
eukprot:2379459-Prymnesium_polylepis.1